MNDLLVKIAMERDGACHRVRHSSTNADVHERSKAQVSARCESQTSRKHDTRGVHSGQTAERAKGDTPVTISA